MKPAFRLWVILTLGLALAAAGAQDRRGLEVVARPLAGDSVKVGRQIAVFIAINKYRDWNPLMNPVPDARELKAILERRYWVDAFFELYDGEATKANILRLFAQLGAETGPDDSVFIYYAGHGYLDQSKTGFWIPVDAGTDLFAQNNWIPNVQIRNLITGMKARHVALVSDSCFSGDILNLSRGAPPVLNDEYFRNAYRRMARQVLTSGASETVSDDSSFSRQLKLVLDRNADPYLDPYALFDQVRRGVSGQTPLYGTIVGAHQEGGSFLFFLRDAPSAPAASSALSRGVADLVVTTEPPGALVLVDGREVGRADRPLIVPRLEAGKPLRIEARLGDLSATRELSLSAGKPEAIRLVLALGTGNFFVRAPEEAKGLPVFIDDVAAGNFDSGLYRDIPAGQRRFELRSTFLKGSAQVRVEPGATASAELALTRLAALSLELPEFLRGARLSVDGAPVELRGGRALVEAGNRLLRLEHPSVEPVEERLSLAYQAELAW